MDLLLKYDKQCRSYGTWIYFLNYQSLTTLAIRYSAYGRKQMVKEIQENVMMEKNDIDIENCKKKIIL